MSLAQRILAALFLVIISAAIGMLPYYSLHEGHSFAPGALASLTLLFFFVQIFYVAWSIPAGIIAGIITLWMQWPLTRTPNMIPPRSRVLVWICIGLTPLYFVSLVLFVSLKGRMLIVCGGIHAAWLAILGLLSVGIRRSQSGFLIRIFHIVLYGGLFYCAFPYLPLSEF